MIMSTRCKGSYTIDFPTTEVLHVYMHMHALQISAVVLESTATSAARPGKLLRPCVLLRALRKLQEAPPWRQGPGIVARGKKLVVSDSLNRASAARRSQEPQEKDKHVNR